LLQNLLQPTDPRQQQAERGAVLSNLVTQGKPAAVAGYYAPQRAADIASSTQGLFGIRQAPTAAQMLTDDPTLLQSSAGMIKAAQALRNVDPAKAATLMVMAQQKQQEEQLKKETETTTRQQQIAQQAEQEKSRSGLVSLVAGSTLPTSQKEALATAAAAGNFDGQADKLLKYVYPAEEKRFLVAGNNIWDTTKGTWAEGASPEAVLGRQAAVAPTPSLEDLPGIDFDQYDPKAFAEASKAYRAATTEDARVSALAVLRPKLDAGEEWRTVKGTVVPWPASGAPRREAESSVSAFNQAKNNVIRKSDVVIDTIDDVLNSIASGKTDTGASAVLGFIPGTGAFDQRMNVNTLLANLGFGELQSMRSAAASGASGLGQLTEKELSRLESLAGNLSLAQTREQFVSRVNDIRSFYAGLKTDYANRGDMTIEDYAGVPRTEYIIEEVE